MPSRPQRLVRRKPLSERIQAFLNPMDFYLWLSEEIQTFDWDSNTFGTRFGLAANFLFLLARANSSASQAAADDVFGDAPASSWVAFVTQTLVWGLASVSLANAFYAMTRSRHYRLFEANVEKAGPSTPNAQRVRVDSSPASSSPMQYLHDMIGSESAEARAHPDITRDVWELRVWDPYPATLRILCLFSPGHVLVHLLFLPLPPLDPRPSVSVFKCLVLQVILSAQLLLLQTRFTQQAKDTAIIQREVLHEYDTKFVHPRLHPVVREAGVQVSIGEGGLEEEAVEVGTPTTQLLRGFKTNPNPNYAKHYDPDSMGPQTRNVMSPSLFTPPAKHSRPSDGFTQSRPSGLRQSLPASIVSPPIRSRQSLPPNMQSPPIRPLQPQSTLSTGISTAVRMSPPEPNYGGGNLGVYQHVNSPLKKATSMGDMKSPIKNSRDMAAMEQRGLAERMIKQSSPVKDNRRATTHGFEPLTGQSARPYDAAAARANRWNQERFPSRVYQG
ncbi:hypothetical protein GQ53DRAFT_188037 [Thozetella sp. PMI_491]|nr:hypothetical protein GQ53DRAFT_188037 [Thozetella sp. PMI_491]